MPTLSAVRDHDMNPLRHRTRSSIPAATLSHFSSMNATILIAGARLTTIVATLLAFRTFDHLWTSLAAVDMTTCGTFVLPNDGPDSFCSERASVVERLTGEPCDCPPLLLLLRRFAESFWNPSGTICIHSYTNIYHIRVYLAIQGFHGSSRDIVGFHSNLSYMYAINIVATMRQFCTELSSRCNCSTRHNPFRRQLVFFCSEF